MDIEVTLRRTVEKYRKTHGEYPGRILLKGEAAKAMADCLVKRDAGTIGKLSDLRKPTVDEVFLDGGMAYFKSIPVIAELEPENELIVE